MGGYNDLKTAITALIHTNDNQEITGATLQSALLSIINTIGQGSVFKGVATTSTNPGSPDADVFYIAGRPGYYPNFNLELTAGLHVIENKSGAWVNTKIALDFVDAIDMGGSKHIKPSQAMIAALQSVEQIPDSEGLANKMWWSTDGHLKHRHNDIVYDLGNPAYVLYYCGDNIYKWTGSGFREMGGGGTFASGEAVSSMSIFDDGSDTDGKSSAQLAAMIPSGEVIKSLLEIISSIDTSGGSYDGVDLITTFSYDAPTRVITVKQSGRQAKTIILPLANSTNAGLMSSEDKTQLASLRNLIGKTVKSFNKSIGENGITITLTTYDNTSYTVLIPNSEIDPSVLAGKADKHVAADILAPSQWPRIMLYNIESMWGAGGTPPDYASIPVGSIYLDDSSSIDDPPYRRLFYKKTTEGTSQRIDLGAPQANTIYCHIATGKLYRWIPTQNNNDGAFQQIGGEVDMSNYYDKTDSDAKFATKTELGQKANDNVVVKSVTINGVQKTPQNGNVSFDVQAGETVVINSDGANIVDGQSDSILTAPSSRMVKEIYLNLQKLFDPVNGLANIAFVGTRPTWQNVAIPVHTITRGTMTNVTASLNDTPINSSISVNEGEVTIKLTPVQGAMIIADNISIKLGTEDVPFTTAADNGSTLVTFILAGDITISASASSGRNIIFTGSTGCSIRDAGVAIGQDLDTVITANEHFTLPSSITVKIGNANITHTYMRTQGNKTATLHIDAANITGDLTITCTANEEAHAIINLTGANSGVIVSHTNLAHVYVGDIITILPASGNKVTASVTVGGNAIMLNGNTYDGYTYTVGSGDVSNNGTAIAIMTAGSALSTFNITLNKTSDVGVTWNTPSAAAQTILEGSPFSVTLTKVSGTGVLNISTSTMGSETLTPNNGTIATDHVTGNITIAASVAAAQMKVHSYNSKDVDANNKNYMVDSEGEFPLYLQADAGYDTNNYPAGYYANGINDGYRVGYGSNRTLNIEQGGDFTVVIKNIVMYVNANNIGYNSQQFLVRFYDRSTLNVGTQNREGQFQLTMSSQDDNGSGFSGNMYPHIAYYSSSGIVKKIFKDDGAVGSIPGARSKISGTDTYTNTYHIAVSYNASTKIATAYVIDIDNVNNNVSVKLSGVLTIVGGLIMPCIATQKYLDVFNYVLSQQDLESEYSVN